MTKDELGLGKLVERLRSRKGEAITRTEKLMDEAADALTALIAERDALAKALEPFADFGEYLKVETEGFSDDDELVLVVEDSGFRFERFKIAAFRLAASTLNLTVNHDG